MNIFPFKEESRGYLKIKRLLSHLNPDSVDGTSLYQFESPRALDLEGNKLVYIGLPLPDGNVLSIICDPEEGNPLFLAAGLENDFVGMDKMSEISQQIGEIAIINLLKKIKELKKHIKPVRQEAPARSYSLSNSRGKKLSFPTIDGIEFVPISRIVRCESDNGYTEIFLDDNTKVCTTRKLKELEELLEDYPFFRIHRSHLVNVDLVKKYKRSEGGSYVILENGEKFPVSRRKRDAFLGFLGQE